MALLATVATFGFPDFDPPIILDLYQRLGCRASQFYRNEANPPAAADVARICADAGVPVDSMHGVFGPAYDPSSPDEAIRGDSVAVYQREAETALRIGGPKVVVHPAPLTQIAPGMDPVVQQHRQDALRRSMDELAAIGGRQGVVFLIENLPRESLYGSDPFELAQMIRELDSPHVRMCLDLGHALLTTADISRCIRACGDVVDYLHVHDNDGVRDLHLMPGDGVMNWPAVRNALRGSALAVSAMLEVFYLRDRLATLVNSELPVQLAEWLDVDAASAPTAAR